MNVDSRNERNDFSLEWVKQQLRAMSAVEPPRGLRERLLAGVPGRATNEASQWQAWRWPRATGWAGIAAAIVVLCGALWLRPPAGPSAKLSSDANGGLGRVLAADYNSVRPADINVLDSNGRD
jgi:hypothetical protein